MSAFQSRMFNDQRSEDGVMVDSPRQEMLLLQQEAACYGKLASHGLPRVMRQCLGLTWLMQIVATCMLARFDLTPGLQLRD